MTNEVGALIRELRESLALSRISFLQKMKPTFSLPYFIGVETGKSFPSMKFIIVLSRSFKGEHADNIVTAWKKRYIERYSNKLENQYNEASDRYYRSRSTK